MTFAASDDAVLIVLLIDDSESQLVRISDCLQPYGIRVEWRTSYREAVALLRDPDVGQLVDLVLIDQAFDSDAVPSVDLLTASEVDPRPGMDEWDVNLHQGLFILSRLGQDMRDGLIPFTPMVILTHYAKLEIAAQTGELGGYLHKRTLLSDPYTALVRYLEQLRPSPADVDRRVRKLAADLGLAPELVRELRSSILAGLDPDAACVAVRGLADPNDWRRVGVTLDALLDQRRTLPPERLAQHVAHAWFPSAHGWLRVCQVEPLGPLPRGFETFRLEIGRPGSRFIALLAARAMRADELPGAVHLRDSFAQLRRIDPRSHAVRLRAGWWTILGCWLREPDQLGTGAGAAGRRLIGATCHVRELHDRGLAHGSMSGLATAFERPIFGGVRCLAGERDLAALRRDDLRQLPALAAAAFGEDPPPGTRDVLDRWSDAVAAADLARAEHVLRQKPLDGDPPAYYDFDRLVSGGEGPFRDLLLASLSPADAVLREVCSDESPLPVDFVVCAGAAVAVLEHRSRVRRAVLAGDRIADVEADVPDVDLGRCERSLARCRRSATVLAARVEARLGLAPGAIRQLPAIVVPDGTEVAPPGDGRWRPVMTETEVVTELAALSAGDRSPTGEDMARELAPRAQPAPFAAVRALRWTPIPIGDGLTRMRTWRKQWPPESWHQLLGGLAAAREALEQLALEDRPLPLAALRAADDAGEPAELDAGGLELVEYDVRVPGSATPLASSFPDVRGQATRRRMAADVLRTCVRWLRSGLAYRRLGPDGLVCAGERVYGDLLQFVVRANPDSVRRQCRGAAACLVLLLSPWPYAWPAVLAGTVPVVPEQSGERSAWGIAAVAAAALLDPQMDGAGLPALLDERAELLDAAARLDSRFPAWPAGLAGEGPL